jgi:hypothetical protein
VWRSTPPCDAHGNRLFVTPADGTVAGLLTLQRRTEPVFTDGAWVRRWQIAVVQRVWRTWSPMTQVARSGREALSGSASDQGAWRHQLELSYEQFGWQVIGRSPSTVAVARTTAATRS